MDLSRLSNFLRTSSLSQADLDTLQRKCQRSLNDYSYGNRYGVLVTVLIQTNYGQAQAVEIDKSVTSLKIKNERLRNGKNADDLINDLKTTVY